MHMHDHVQVTGSFYVCVFSGFSGAEQPRGGVSGAGAPAGRACDGCSGGDPWPDGSVREAGGGAVHPRQHSPLR